MVYGNPPLAITIAWSIVDWACKAAAQQAHTSVSSNIFLFVCLFIAILSFLNDLEEACMPLRTWPTENHHETAHHRPCPVLLSACSGRAKVIVLGSSRRGHRKIAARI